MAKVRREAGEPLEDDAALLALARLALGGPREAGRSSYQVALTVCEQCRKGWQEGQGELVEVSSEVVEMAECDAQHIGTVAGAPSAHVDATSSVRERGGAHSSKRGNDGTRGYNGARVDVAVRTTRAKQSVPPSVRRQVLRRDGGRCRVPGCRHATFVDVHHRKPRSEHGGHHPENLITLCSAHHRALHEGALVIDGSAASPCFRHSDGTLYGCLPSPEAVESFVKASQGLRNMGFRETEVQRALATIDAGPNPDFATIIR
ncbi:MAG TPA: HNH endonuclease, partial [Polyangiaceae bacterium]